MRTASRMAVASFLLCFVISGQASAWQDQIFKCTPLSVATFGNDGRLEMSNDPQAIGYEGLIVDTATGAVRWPSWATATKWRLVQKGSNANDYVFIKPSMLEAMRGDMALAAAATDFLRVRVWKENKTPTFMLVALSKITTGSCQPVQ